MIEKGAERLGEVVGRRYELRDVLGHGGQSVIYRAKDKVAGDEVAIKIVTAGDGDGTDRLFREAQALLALGGTAALRVLHQTHTDDGAACLVTELLRGRNLSDHLAEIEQDGARMPIPELVTTFAPIVRTLEVARQHGIVHRDLKAENIFVVHPAYGGGVRLLDFGFTKFVHARRLTAPGLVAGSPTHLAPEAWAGVTDIDHRADVYGLAVVLFRVLGGKVPFSGQLHELLKIVRTAPRPSLHALRPDLSPIIDDWVAHALAVDREQRFQRTSALFSALLSCLGVERNG